MAETSEFFKRRTIYFSPSTTVAELKHQLQIELGLATKVFRKSADSWINTTQTADLTLGKQNNIGPDGLKAQINLHTLFL